MKNFRLILKHEKTIALGLWPGNTRKLLGGKIGIGELCIHEDIENTSKLLGGNFHVIMRIMTGSNQEINQK